MLRSSRVLEWNIKRTIHWGQRAILLYSWWNINFCEDYVVIYSRTKLINLWSHCICRVVMFRCFSRNPNNAAKNWILRNLSLTTVFILCLYPRNALLFCGDLKVIAPFAIQKNSRWHHNALNLLAVVDVLLWDKTFESCLYTHHVLTSQTDSCLETHIFD